MKEVTFNDWLDFAVKNQGMCLLVVGPSHGFTGAVSGVRVLDDQVVDPAPFPIVDGAALSTGHTVAWDGGQFRDVFSPAGAVHSVAVTEAGQVGSPIDVGISGGDPIIGCGGDPLPGREHKRALLQHDLGRSDAGPDRAVRAFLPDQ